MKAKHLSKLRRHLLLAFLISLLLLVIPMQTVLGQDVANGQATATVMAGLVVTAVQDLAFGNVLQGVAKSTPNDDDANSGIFSITGAASAGLSIYLTLPDYMALADGSDRMTVAFSSTDATVDTTVATPSTVVAGDGWVDVNPRGLGTLGGGGAVVGTGGQTNLYLGGKVTPAVDQSAGAYTGDLICTVAYNGT
jgi:hypothetical protein